MSIKTIEASYKGKTVKLRADWDRPMGPVELWQNGKWANTNAPVNYQGSGAQTAWLVFLLTNSVDWTDRQKCYEHVSGILNGSIIEVQHNDRSIRLRSVWDDLQVSRDYGDWADPAFERWGKGGSGIEADRWMHGAIDHCWGDLSDDVREAVYREWCYG